MFHFTTTNQKRPQLVPFTKKTDKLKKFQAYVEGYIETLPHKNGYESPFLAYANEDGMTNDLPSNYLSFGVLRHLGFVCPLAIPFHFGNILLLGKNEKALTKRQQEQVEDALQKYYKEMGDDEDDDDDEEEEEEEEEELDDEEIQERPAKKVRKE